MLNRAVTRIGLGLFLVPLALVGCGHTETTADGGKVTVEGNGKFTATDSQGNTATVTDSGNKMTVTSKDGKSEYEANNGTMKAHDSQGNSVEMGTGVSEAELGLPFYPGSTDGKNSVKSNTDKDSTVMSNRVTTDAPAKVVEFYTGKLGKPSTSVNADTMAMASWKSGKKTESLIASKEADGTKISLTVVNQK